MKRPPRNKAALFIAVVALSACGMTVPQAGMPDLSFRQIQPVYVAASQVNVVSQYNPSADHKDISAILSVPPDLALKRYAENRFRANGTPGQFRFLIEDAGVHQNEVYPDNKMLKWMRVGKVNELEVSLRVRVASISAGQTQGPETSYGMRRTIQLPSSLSIADREMKQMAFIKEVIDELDGVIIKNLRSKGLLSNIAPALPAMDGIDNVSSYPIDGGAASGNPEPILPPGYMPKNDITVDRVLDSPEVR